MIHQANAFEYTQKTLVILTFYIKDATVLTTGTKWKYPQLYFTVRMVLVLLVRWLQSLNMQITFQKVKLLDKYLTDDDLLSEHFNHFALFDGTTP